ncbi:MAG: ATP synthase F1 subunit delta [Sedimentisphaerales bacterium]|nr:ATP synthase F1 subunit delta [Sedimentisphaerales bacterium]
MAKDHIQAVAEVYTRAIFQLAQERSLTEQVGDDLRGISELIGNEADFAHFLASPAISQGDKCELLKKAFSGQIEELTEDLLMVLAQRDRLNVLQEIAGCYQDMLNEVSGIVFGKVTTAVPLADSEFSGLSASIGASLGRKIQLTPVVDPSIIGGMILQIGNKNIDGSLRRRLERVSVQLKSQKIADVQLMIENA